MSESDLQALRGRAYVAALGLGLTEIRIPYDGSGDSGSIDINGMQAETGAGTKFAAELGEKGGPALLELLEQLAEAALATADFDWYNNDGAYGDVVLDVVEDTLTIKNNQRVYGSEYGEYSL